MKPIPYTFIFKYRDEYKDYIAIWDKIYDHSIIYLNVKDNNLKKILRIIRDFKNIEFRYYNIDIKYDWQVLFVLSLLQTIAPGLVYFDLDSICDLDKLNDILDYDKINLIGLPYNSFKDVLHEYKSDIHEIINYFIQFDIVFIPEDLILFFKLRIYDMILFTTISHNIKSPEEFIENLYITSNPDYFNIMTFNMIYYHSEKGLIKEDSNPIYVHYKNYNVLKNIIFNLPNNIQEKIGELL
jgi:hypothetical protein